MSGLGPSPTHRVQQRFVPLRDRPGEAICCDCRQSFQAGIYARYCLACRWKHRGRRAKYVWTPEKDKVLRERYTGFKGSMPALAAAVGFPKWAVQRRAAALGLTRRPNSRPWTREEETLLVEHLGSRHIHWISRQLGRSLASVTLKVKRMKLSRAWREGYTMRELELCFGVDHHEIERWIRAGQLTGRRRGTERRSIDPWCFDDADLLRFIQEHPMAFKLHRVDQLWFMDLITAGGLVRRALTALKEGAA